MLLPLTRMTVPFQDVRIIDSKYFDDRIMEGLE